MVNSCCVAGCKNNQRDIKMHVFPKDPELFRFWLDAVKLEFPIETRHNHRICDVHFSSDVKFIGNHNRSTLKPNAVPNLYLFADQTFDLPGTSSSAFSSSDVPMSVPAELQLIGDSIHGKADENEGSNTVTTTEPLSRGREGSPLEHPQLKVSKVLSSPRTPRFRKGTSLQSFLHYSRYR